MLQTSWLPDATSSSIPRMSRTAMPSVPLSIPRTPATLKGSLFVLPAGRSDELTAASERLVSGPADVMSGGVARRSGEAGAEQHNAPDWVLGRRPRRCLIELRGGQDRTTRPGLHRLRLHSRKQPLCTNKPLVETNPEPAN